MDDELDSGAYNPDLVTQQDDGEQPLPSDGGIAQSAPPDDAGEEPSTDGSGGQPPDDSAPPVPEGRKKERGWAGEIFDFLRDQFGVGEPGLSARRVGSANPDHEPEGLPTQAGEEPEEQPGHGPTGLPTQGSMGQDLQDEIPGQPLGQPPQMEAQPPVPYTGQPGQPDVVPGQPAASNPPRPLQYLQGAGAEDNATRKAREDALAAQLPPGADINTVRSEALRQNVEKSGPEAAGAQLQNHRDNYNKFKAMAGAALDHGDPTNAASLYNEAHTFMPDGHKMTASPGANGGMNLNIQDLTGHKPPQDIQLSEDQFRELTHMRAGEFDHVFERGIDKNAADLARTPGMPRGTLDQASGVAKQSVEPYQDHTAWNTSKQIANEAPYDPRPGHWQTQAEQPRGQNGFSRNVPDPDREQDSDRTQRGGGSGRTQRGGGRGRRSEAEPVEGRQETAFGSGTGAPTTDGQGGSARLGSGSVGAMAARLNAQGGIPQPTYGAPTSEHYSPEARAARRLPNGTEGEIAALAQQLHARDMNGESTEPFQLKSGDRAYVQPPWLRTERGNRTAQVAAGAEQLRVGDKGKGSDYEGRAARQNPQVERAPSRPDQYAPDMNAIREGIRTRNAPVPEATRGDRVRSGSEVVGRPLNRDTGLATAPGRDAYDAVSREEYGTTVPQVQRMQPTPQGQGQPAPQGQPFQRPLPQGSSSEVSKGNHPQLSPGRGDATSKGDYLRGQGRDQGSPMGDAAIRPDPTSAENRAAHMLPNGTPEQLSRLADQFRATDRMLNDRLNAQVGPDPNAGNYRAAPSGMPASTLGGSAKSELRGRDLDLKERDIDRKSGQGDRRLDFLKDQATGKLDESTMRHLDQANGTNISNAIRAANAKVNAGIPLTARDTAALDRAGDLAITPPSRPNMQGVAPPVPGVPRQGAPARAAPPPRAQPRGEWRTNTTTGERRWFPAQ